MPNSLKYIYIYTFSYNNLYFNKSSTQFDKEFFKKQYKNGIRPREIIIS